VTANENTDLIQALQALAGIPIEQLGRGKGTFADAEDDCKIHTWNWHSLTVGHVKAARRILEKMKREFNDSK
jgi:hypothetical protein